MNNSQSKKIVFKLSVLIYLQVVHKRNRNVTLDKKLGTLLGKMLVHGIVKYL